MRFAHRRMLFLALGIFHSLACRGTVRQPIVHEASTTTLATLDTGRLKAHHRSGALDVFTSWRLEGDSVLTGTGAHYDVDRVLVRDGELRLALDSIALLESNDPQRVASFGLTILNLWTVAWGFVTGACVVDPKTCFGSCPTFYLDDVSRDRPIAEGFSSSVARALEATDLDDLGQRRRGGTTVTLRMMNEAWETQVVRSARLRAVPVRPDQDVFATDASTFHTVNRAAAATSCVVGGADCRAAVAARDGVEWRGTTDAADLATPDTAFLAFPAIEGPAALILGARQTFVSTFVLYQSMAYLGTQAGDWLAALERRDPAVALPLATVNRLIGEMEIETRIGRGAWRPVGRFREAGPIALDVKLFPLGTPLELDSVHVRLIFAKGNWRLGYAALASLGPALSAVTLDPERVERIATAPVVRAQRESNPAIAADPTRLLRDPARTLQTYPGDGFALTYQLPGDAAEYALFLESRGYYHEWMRGEWLEEEDAAMTALLRSDPQ